MVAKSLFLTLTFCWVYFGVFAQERISLSSVPVDTAYVNLYLHNADKMERAHPDSAAGLYKHALQMSRSINYYEGALHCLIKIGSYYFNEKQDFGQSRRYLLQALPYCKELSRKRYSLIPTVYNLLGNAYFKTGLNDSAIWYYTRGLRVIDSLSLDMGRLSVMISSNIGSVLAASRQYRQGADYIKKAIVLQKTALDHKKFNHEDSSMLAANYGNLGALYASFLNNMDSAVYWWSQGIKLYRAMSMDDPLQDIYVNIAVGWLLVDHLDISKAECYLDTAIRTNPAKAPDKIEMQYALATVCYYKGSYPLAIKHCERALVLCGLSGTPDRQKDIYEVLSYCYAHLGDAPKSQKYRQLFFLYTDSLLDEEITQSISQMEVRYRISQKDKELAENKATLYRQRYWLTGSIACGFVLFLSLIGLIRNGQQKRRLHREQFQNLQHTKKIEQLHVKMEAEEQERTRIAHELHDSLGVLLSAAKINHTLLGKVLPAPLLTASAYLESSQIISQMQQEIKTIANNLVPDYITHKSFEAAITTLALKFNREDVFNVHIYSYGEVRDLHPDRSFALYRVIEEIINNAVKHSDAGELVIQLMYHPDQLHITIEDNGKGFDPEQSYVGLGLQSIRGRVDLLKGYLHLSSEKDNGTTYNLEVPY